MKNFLKNIEFDEYSKDSKINASNILMNTNKVIPDDLVAATVLSIFLVNKNEKLYKKFIEENNETLTDSLVFGVNAAVKIMNMNNVYYRGKHILDDSYKNIKANLRMNIYGNHGIDNKYFEFISLAISFINNCEFCIKSHAKLLEKEGMKKEQIHEALRIASIFNNI